MAFIDKIKERAKADKKTIVLPESMDKRTYEAAEKILKEGIANLIIIGTPEEIEKNGKGFDISGATIVDPYNDPNKQKYIDKFVELRGKKGVTPEVAKEQMEKDYMYYACLMCKCGDADGAVSGACHSTGNTIRPALQLLKTKPGISSVSGFFLMEVPDCEFGENGLFVFADCAVNTDFDSNKLAEIAGLSAESFKMLVGAEPKVAMLSYSSMGSAKHDDVTKVADAVKIAHEKNMSIEAEVGSIGGEEDGVIGKGECADPQECKMVSDLGIDFLAAGIGNIHGKYPANWKGLSFETLDAIQQLTGDMPLVLHGGTGIPADMIKKAIDLGVSKINVNTECQLSFAAATRKYIEEGKDQQGKGYDPRKLLAPGFEAIKATVKEKMELFGSVGKAE